MKFDAPIEVGMNSQNFLKLKGDKESATGIFKGEIHHFKTHWKDNRSSTCTNIEGAHCAICAQGNRPSFRFRVNFIIKEASGAYTARIFEQGLTVYQTLKSLHESGYNLETTVVKITRMGTDKNSTTYNILPVPPPQGVVSESLARTLNTVALHDLANPEAVNANIPPKDNFDDIPF